jgi:repressor LexA
MPDEITLTKRQSAILLAIEAYTAANGFPPSIREIGDAVGLASTSSVAYQLDTLEGLGHLRRPRAGGARAIQLTTKAAA